MIIKDSKIDVNWLQDMMRKVPPQVRPNGIILSGPVRLSFANIFKPRRANQPGADEKFGAALLFPPGTDMSLFQNIWITEAKKAFPNNWDPQGQPVGLHLPFHDQAEKAYGQKPLPGYTPGAYTFNVSSKFKPPVVDSQMNPIGDESRVYSGVWALIGMNTYHFGISPPQPKKGVSFGIQTVMIIADDTKLGGGGGDPTKDFAGITISAQSNIAQRFDQAPAVQPTQGAPMLMPSGAGTPGGFATQPLPTAEDELRRQGLL